MKARLEILADHLRLAGNEQEGDYRNFFHDRAKMIESWIRGYEFGDEGDVKYRTEVVKEFEALVNI